MTQQRAGFCGLVPSSLVGPCGCVCGGGGQGEVGARGPISLTPGRELGAWNELSFADPCSH